MKCIHWSLFILIANLSFITIGPAFAKTSPRSFGHCPTRKTIKNSQEIFTQQKRHKHYVTSFLYDQVKEKEKENLKDGMNRADAKWWATVPKTNCHYKPGAAPLPKFRRIFTGINAKANQSRVLEDVVFMTYSHKAWDRTEYRIKHCILIHGYGITPFAYDVVSVNRGVMIDFISAYFGNDTVKTLLKTVCGKVTVALQESNDTSILEMTKRTEKLIRHLKCSGTLKNGIWPCGVIGHSKGGAVATNIARRCMEKDPRSLLGEKSCKSIGEFYSATGVPLGAGASFLIKGVRHLDNTAQKINILKILSGVFVLPFNFMTFTIPFRNEPKTFAETLGSGLATSGNLVWNLTGDFDDNPTWRDLSPGTKMEGGIPLYVYNNRPLNKTGWLVADYAASGTKFTFSGDKYFGGPGCGESTETGSWGINRAICRTFDLGLASIHDDLLRNIYTDGLRMVRHDTRFFDPEKGNANYLKVFDWMSYQVNDGFADYQSALGTCWQGGSAINPRDCKTFKNINHQASAGGSREALTDFVIKFSH